MDKNIFRLWVAILFLVIVNIHLICICVSLNNQFKELTYEHYTYRLLVLVGVNPKTAIKYSKRSGHV